MTKKEALKNAKELERFVVDVSEYGNYWYTKVFKTEEEAEEHVEYLGVLGKVLDLYLYSLTCKPGKNRWAVSWTFVKDPIWKLNDFN